VENKKYILKKENGEVIARNMKIATTMFERMKGLMFSEDLPDCDAFLIKPCNSIHTFFMLYPLDVLFLDSDFRVVKSIRNIKPWRMTWLYLKSSQVLEMKAGSLNEELSVGDKLEVVCIN
jgi:uncharacterized membrane protein (UPF0127 family)